MAETGSVSFMFDRVGQLVYAADVADPESMFEAAVEAGADNVESSETLHRILCEPSEFATVRDDLIERFGNPAELGLVWEPQNTICLLYTSPLDYPSLPCGLIVGLDVLLLR